MAQCVTKTIPSLGYGVTNALQDLAQAPIAAKRGPTVNDAAENGTIWVDTNLNSASVFTGTSSGIDLWDGIANTVLSVNSLPATGANSVAVLSGTGVPTLILPAGSLYMRVDGSSGTTRAYISEGAGVWTDISTAA